MKRVLVLFSVAALLGALAVACGGSSTGAEGAEGASMAPSGGEASGTEAAPTESGEADAGAM